MKMEGESKRKLEKGKRELEKRIIQILTERRLSAFKEMLEKDHAIDCILLATLGRGQWKLAKDFMRQLNLTLPDGTYRARMIEIEENRLVRHEKMDVKKKRWVLTQLGSRFSELLIEFFATFMKEE
jgi:hypothetical protein